MPPNGAATHARLIDEAMTQVTVRGLAAVSLQDVAGAAGGFARRHPRPRRGGA